MKRIIAGIAFSSVALTAITAMAQPMNHFSGFEAEQHMIDDTISRVEAQRVDGRGQFDGHAEKAEALLRQAKAELTAATQYRLHH